MYSLLALNLTCNSITLELLILLSRVVRLKARSLYLVYVVGPRDLELNPGLVHVRSAYFQLSYSALVLNSFSPVFASSVLATIDMCYHGFLTTCICCFIVWKEDLSVLQTYTFCELFWLGSLELECFCFVLFCCFNLTFIFGLLD